MTDLNKTILIGRMTRDAELRYTASGIPVSNFSVAVNYSKKQDGKQSDIVSFFDCQLWGIPAEKLNQYLIKGKQVAIEGRLKQERWEKDGRQFSKVIIECNSIQLLSSKNNSADTQIKNTQNYEDDFSAIEEDDSIPF